MDIDGGVHRRRDFKYSKEAVIIRNMDGDKRIVGGD